MIPGSVHQHLIKYWRTSVRFFEEGDYALASFFAITLIEEIGKTIILGYKELGGKFDEKGFRNHKSKYMYAVYHTLLINSRVSRIYGAQEARFAKWFTSKELFTIRNNSLYIELSSEKVVTPQQVITASDAFLLVCISGEVLAEIQGTFTGAEPIEWQTLIQAVDVFRENNKDFLPQTNS